jgi:hypothetical protein
MKDVGILFNTLDHLWQNYLHCRAFFPCVTRESVGTKTVRTAPYYIAQGCDMTLEFGKPLSAEAIDRINEIGHWISQNFVIRLCAVLESFGVISERVSIDPKLDGARHVDIVRRLKNCFTHSSGRFDPENAKHRKALQLMRDHLGISIENCATWPLAIDTVLDPLLRGCKTYAGKRLGSA